MRRIVLLSALAALPLLSESTSHAQSCAPPYSGISPNSNVNVIGTYVAPGFPSSISSPLSQATSAWNSSCGGTSIPCLQDSPCNGSGCIVVAIEYQPGVSTTPTGGCGVFTPSLNQAGQISGGTITLFETATNGVPCAGDYNYVIAHELGHALGLGDNSSCVGRIMGRESAYGQIPGIVSEDCGQADQMNYTTWESQQDYCSSHCWTTCVNGQCPNNYRLDGCGDDCSPIVLDFANAQYAFSAPSDGVMFDIDGDGSPDRVAWPTEPAATGFLYMDRNGNGRPDDGGELFGNACRLKSGGLAPHGFAALAELDSDGDGLITRADARWGDLGLWFDLSRDGKADTGEMVPLDAMGVVALQVTPTWTGRRDRFGNTLRWKAMFGVAAGDHVEQRPYYDVYLKIAR